MFAQLNEGSDLKKHQFKHAKEEKKILQQMFYIALFKSSMLSISFYILGPLLLIWFNSYPSMDK